MDKDWSGDSFINHQRLSKALNAMSTEPDTPLLAVLKRDTGWFGNDVKGAK